MAVAITSPERRNSPRIPVSRIAYVNFEDNNGGIILNISEQGICFHSVAPLHQEGTIPFSISHGGSSRLEGVAELVWADESQKRGGLHFVKMSEQAREKVFEAVSRQGVRITATRDAPRDLVSSARGLIRIRVPGSRLFHGFAGGVAVGCLVSALIIGAFFSHRELGGVFIRVGELLGAKAETQNGYIAGSHAETTLSVQPMSRYSQDVHQQRSSLERTKRHKAQENTHIIVPAVAIKVKREPVHILLESQATLASPLRAEVHASNAASSLPFPLTAPLAKALVPQVPITLTEESGLPRPKLAPQTTIELQSRTASTRSIDQLYFEIGKFKQQFWAKDETEKVAKLGFPVTILHRRNLWMSSYRVLVGPYHAREEAEAAHRNLVSRGFEPRPFERGARNFVLPTRLILHGTQAPAGECIIQWESYINTVKVSFRQDNLVSATAEGVWVDRGPKYENSATVYTQNRDGSRILSEIRFEGMNRALVFP